MAQVEALFYNNPDLYPPVINGIWVLANSGVGVRLLCRDFGGKWQVRYPPDVTIQRIQDQGSSWQGYARFVAAAMRHGHRRADIYIGHDMHGFLPARLLAARFQRPLIYHCHDFADDRMPLALGGRIVRWFERACARTADLVIVPEAARAEVVAKVLHLAKPPLVVANAPLALAAENTNSLHEALAAQGRVFDKILFRQGRIGEGHTVETTLRSLPQWRESTWGFVLMGYGDPAYVRTAWSLAQALGVHEQFAVLPPVGYDEVRKFTVGADAGHALYEPIHINNRYISTASNKIMEYMAAGLPVLGSDQPDIRQLLETYGCGLVADASSPADIARAVNHLFGNEKLAQSLGVAGQCACREKFNYARQYGPVVEWIQAHSKES